MQMRLTFLAAAAVAAAAFSSPAAAQAGVCTNGTATLGGMAFPCSGVDALGRVSNQTLGAGAPGTCTQPYPNICANDIWGWTDPADGHEYALVGLHNGTAFVDVTVPTAPRMLGRLPSATTASSWRDVKTIGHYALIVSEANNHGMQIFDLYKLRGLSESASRTFTADARYTRVGSAHNLVVDEATGFAYAVGFRPQGAGLPAACTVRGFHAINLSDPLNPTFAGCFNDAAQEQSPYVGVGYTHDAQCLVYTGPDADYTGREMCFASNEDVLTIFDVTDKSNVRIVSQGGYPDDAYSHQGWLTADQRYFLLGDEIDEEVQVNNGQAPNQRTIVFDLQDLDNPEFTFQYLSGLTTIDHNLYTKGRYAYESNYESGLRILDLSGIGQQQITEAAYFDTFPQSTAVEYDGQWSNYPFFPSGNVIVSDVTNGLFVLRPTGLNTASEPAAPSTGRGFALSAPAPEPRLRRCPADAHHGRAAARPRRPRGRARPRARRRLRRHSVRPDRARRAPRRPRRRHLPPPRRRRVHRRNADHHLPLSPGLTSRMRLACLAALLVGAAAAHAQTAEPDAIAQAGLTPQPSEDGALAATPCVNGFAGVYKCSGIDLAARMPLSSSPRPRRRASPRSGAGRTRRRAASTPSSASRTASALST